MNDNFKLNMDILNEVMKTESCPNCNSELVEGDLNGDVICSKYSYGCTWKFNSVVNANDTFTVMEQLREKHGTNLTVCFSDCGHVRIWGNIDIQVHTSADIKDDQSSLAISRAALACVKEPIVQDFSEEHVVTVEYRLTDKPTLLTGEDADEVSEMVMKYSYWKVAIEENEYGTMVKVTDIDGNLLGYVKIIEHPIMNTLADCLPADAFFESEDRIYKFKDHKVVSVQESFMTHWPGKHKNVHVWWILDSGHAVGWNESPARGWSFPIIKLK